jgi:hypothetical protein
MPNTLRSNDRTMRFAASTMLLAWLFMSTLGAVFAYIVEVRESPRLGVSAAHTWLETARSHAADTSDEEHHTDAEPTKESCLKACDADFRSLLKQASGLDSSRLELALFAVRAWAPKLWAATPVVRAYDSRLRERSPHVAFLLARPALQTLLEVSAQPHALRSSADELDSVLRYRVHSQLPQPPDARMRPTFIRKGPRMNFMSSFALAVVAHWARPERENSR